MAIEDNQASPSPLDTGLGYDGNTSTFTYNGTRNCGDPTSDGCEYSYENMILSSFMLLICIFGFVGNGMVTWLLGFQIKKNPFTTYVLNLSVADVGVLMSLFSYNVIHTWVNEFYTLKQNHTIDDAIYFGIRKRNIIGKDYILQNWNENALPLLVAYLLFSELFLFMFTTSQFLLTVLSTDRCLFVFFPIRHQYHRPPELSSTMCALIWVVSFLLCGFPFAFYFIDCPNCLYPLAQVIFNIFLSTPLMTISTLTIFIKLFFGPQQHQQGKLSACILILVLFFLIFAFPLNVSYFIYMFFSFEYQRRIRYALLFACLNSSIKPVIYFLIGKQRRLCRESMKVILQRLFQESEESRGDQHSTTQTQS